jgi:hypothetical protein
MLISAQLKQMHYFTIISLIDFFLRARGGGLLRRTNIVYVLLDFPAFLLEEDLRCRPCIRK